MTTEELLQKATPRPWTHTGHDRGEESIGSIHGYCVFEDDGSEDGGKSIAQTVNTKRRPEKDKRKATILVSQEADLANAELIARAVNSFEAARSALSQVRESLETGFIEQPGRNGDNNRRRLEKAVSAALALMEGKQ